MTTTQGYRAKNVLELYDGPPGGYTPVTSEDTGETVWWVKDPAGYIGRLGNHEVTEHEDGTITVSPSILSQRGPGQEDWHGFLERGIWRDA